MKVKLERNWFGPDGTLYRKVDNPHQFPQAWEDKLPKGATVLASETKEEAPAKPVHKPKA